MAMSGRYGARYWTSPRNFWTSLKFRGVLHSRTLSILSTSADIVWFMTNLLICIWHINLWLILMTSNICLYVVLVREWSDILDRVVIPLPIIHNSLDGSVLFWDTEHWCCLRGSRVNPPLRAGIPSQLFWKLYFQTVGTSWHIVIVPLIFLY